MEPYSRREHALQVIVEVIRRLRHIDVHAHLAEVNDEARKAAEKAALLEASMSHEKSFHRHVLSLAEQKNEHDKQMAQKLAAEQAAV